MYNTIKHMYILRERSEFGLINSARISTSTSYSNFYLDLRKNLSKTCTSLIWYGLLQPFTQISKLYPPPITTARGPELQIYCISPSICATLAWVTPTNSWRLSLSLSISATLASRTPSNDKPKNDEPLSVKHRHKIAG